VTWSISDATLASITVNGDDAAIVTGLAAGSLTLTASDGTVTAQEQVTILSQASFTSGTAIWSAAPPAAGFSVQQVVQAVPSSYGPDLYAISTSADGTQSIIQALQADGEQLWQIQMPPIVGTTVADAFGGLVVTTCASGNPMTVMGLDANGQPLWQQQNAPVTGYGYICYPPQTAVGGDGKAYVAEPTNAGLPSLTVAYPNGYINTVEFPPSTVTNNGGPTQVQCCVGPPMVNTDGNAYVEYEVRTTNNNVITSDNLYLYKATTGSSTVLSSTTQNEALLPGPVIPDGQGGVLATWTVSSPVVQQFPYQAADVTNGVVGTPFNLPFSPQSVTPFVSPALVLGESGTAFASASTTVTINGAQTSVDQVASFSLSSGATNWTYQAASGNHLSIIASSAGNTLVTKNTDSSGNDTVLRFNSGGVPTSDGWTGTSVSYFLTDNIWLGSSSANGPSGIYASPVMLSTSAWYEPDGNTGNAAVQDVSITNFSQTGTNQTTITNVLQKIQGQLPSYSTCNNWLQGAGQNQGTSGLQQIQGLVTNNLFGHATVNVGPAGGPAVPTYTIAAFSGTQNPDKTNIPGLPAGAAMTVNDIGAFFNQSDTRETKCLLENRNIRVVHPKLSPQF
jgi:hypothetical protein